LERRKQLHEAVGRAIEVIYSASLDDHVADLAHHFSLSGNPAKAIEYLQLAGTQAASRGALAQAVHDFENALAVVKALPSGPERDQFELQVLSPLGTAYIAGRGYAAPGVGPVFQRARELSDKIGEPQQQFAVLFGNFAWRVVRGEMGASMTLALEAIDLAKQLDDPGVWMEALFLLGVTLFYRGDFAGAREQYEKALTHYDDRELTRAWAARVGEDAGVTHRCYLALALWHLGYPEKALQVSRETLDLARAIEHPFSLAYAQHHASWLCHQLRLPDETLALSDEGTRTSAEHGFPLFHATGALYHGAGLVLQGQAKTALPTLVKGFDAYRATGAGLAIPYYLSLLADALAQSGAGSEATGVIDNALAIAERSDERCHEAELYRLKGEFALSNGHEPAEVEANFLRALDTARSQQSKAWELRASMSLSRLYRRQNRPDQGRDMLGRVLGSFTEGFGTPDLRDAKALLEQLRA
jgi:predicted ATPase